MTIGIFFRCTAVGDIVFHPRKKSTEGYLLDSMLFAPIVVRRTPPHAHSQYAFIPEIEKVLHNQDNK